MTKMGLQLDHESREPLYRQLRRGIEHQIARGAYRPDKALPSSRALAAELGISRNTVNLAYQELTAEGFLVSRPRSGIFVNGELTAQANAAEHPREHTRVNWASLISPPLDAHHPRADKLSAWNLHRYAFLAGQVDALAYPAQAWIRALKEALGGAHLHYSLRDALSEDDPMLVELLCQEVLPGRGVEAEPSEVLVTLGSQEGLSLLSHVLLRNGSVVAVEDPGYVDARHAFLRAGASLRALPVDSSGVQPPASLEGIDIIYLTPSHQHPTNVTLSIARRRQLLSQANEAGTIVIEDDYDSELRYKGTPSPALKALDQTGAVAYLGTFSKFLAPGLRLGYTVAAPELIAALRDERRYRIRHPPGHLQRAMALFIESGSYARAVRQHRIRLRHKWDTMCDAIERYVPWPVPTPSGGGSIWMEGPSSLDATAMAEALACQGVIIDRGDICYLQPDQHRNCFRLGFAAIHPDAIEPGVRLVAEAATAMLDAR